MRYSKVVTGGIVGKAPESLSVPAFTIAMTLAPASAPSASSTPCDVNDWEARPASARVAASVQRVT